MAQEHDMINPFSEKQVREGLCQILFFQSDEIYETSYADRKGKYQAQKGSCCRSCRVSGYSPV